MDGDSIAAIQRDYLLAREHIDNAFNRLLAIRVPVVPVAMHIQVEVVADDHNGPEAT